MLNIKEKKLLRILFSIYALGSLPVAAAPGVLSDIPLFLGDQVQPNILWIIDDSGSMDSEVLMTQAASDAHTGDSNGGYLDFASPMANRVKRRLCAGYNSLAYDPTKIYIPWMGVDSADSDYADSSFTAARKNPYDINTASYSDNGTNNAANSGYDDSSNNQDLSKHFYYLWTDGYDGAVNTTPNGQYDDGECSTLAHEDADGNFTVDARRIHVSDLSAVNKTNYANWFSYYRKREFVAKRALSELIQGSQSRVGLTTLHRNGGSGALIKDIDDISVPISLAAQSNKAALMQKVFEIESSNVTPLRRKLLQAGQYFDKNDTVGSSFFGFTANPSSPIVSQANGGECQQNFTILMSDGYWNGSFGTPENNGAPAVYEVGNQDENSASEFDGTSHADVYSDTLADIAMKYYKKDLAPNLDNKVLPIEDIDTNEAQHMVTYTVAFGINGNLSSNPTDRDQAFTLANGGGPWPDPHSNATEARIDDMRHAAWNGRGEFLSAGSAETLVSSLLAAINSISDREGSAAAVAFNSTSLKTDTSVFQARFDSTTWFGTLLSFGFDEDGVGAENWDAGEVLQNRDLTANERHIITYNGSHGISFKFPGNYVTPAANEMGANQITDLLTNAPHSPFTLITSEQDENKIYGAKLVDYLRGGRDNEGTLFRNRHNRRLGDIVHSSPEYVEKPNRAYPNLIEPTKAYNTYKALKDGRTAMVYVGANDGMLHAFDAATGDEKFAYIPGLLYSSLNKAGLHYLASKTYTHIPYVDESPLAADVFISGAWKTYLVGSLRAGGKGIYVLDVSTPSSLTEGNASNIVKQEFTHADLGYTFSRPLVGKMNNGKWAAIFGNGYNNTGNGEAKLFILYLDGSGYDEITTSVGSIVNSDCNDDGSDCNGLSSSTILDLDGNGTIDRVYAGDIQGNLWAFDMSSGTGSDWVVAHNNGNPVPLFVSCSATPCSSANRQPITSLVVGKTHPDRLSAGTTPNLLVYFGTGQYLANNDVFSTTAQTMYAVWDAGNLNAQLDRDNLQQQVITVNGGGYRILSENTVDYTVAGKLGWYIDLPDTGERIVVEPSIVENIVFFNTMVPDNSACTGGGYGYLMFADAMTGGLPDFTVFDTNDDGVYDDSIVAGKQLDAIPSGSRIISDKLVISDSKGNISDYGVQTGAARPSSRSSWSIVK